MTKRISKVVVFYDDGTFEEVGAPVVGVQTPPINVSPVKYPNQCLVCADPMGHGNLPCPNLRAFSLNKPE
jgi:hypothetical protein